MTDPSALYEAIADEASTVLVGNEEILKRLSIALLTRGHVLLEGVPGVAKTTVANVFATTTGLDFGRIQMTPDLLPADITGTHVYRENIGDFELRRGPIFANVVVADEINRTTPKTQSALLEAMQERQVTIEGETLSLPDPFIVIATQNPIEMEGTFELPEAQRDRFQMKLRMGLPDSDDERQLLDRFDAQPDLDASLVEQVVDPESLREARQVVTDVYVDDAVKQYILDLVAGTRELSDVEYGASPRATLAFLSTTKARAAIEGRTYVIPDDVKAMAEAILVHRIVLSADADLSGRTSDDVIADLLGSIEPPTGELAPATDEETTDTVVDDATD